MKGLGFWSNLSLRGVSEFEELGFQSNTWYQRSLVNEGFGFKIQLKFKGVFIVNGGWGFQSNTQYQGGLVVHEKLGLFFI
jgi:hypothetical protein